MDLKKNKAQLIAYYKDLPPWAKGVIVVGSAVVVVYTVHAIVKALRDRKKTQDGQTNLVQYVKDLNEQIKNGVPPSYQESQYNQWAASILQQFTGCDASLVQCPDWLFSLGYSDSGYVLAKICRQLKNDADFLCLQVAFGIKTYDACGIWNGDVGPVTLTGAVNDELNSCEVEGLNKILASQGLTYKF